MTENFLKKNIEKPFVWFLCGEPKTGKTAFYKKISEGFSVRQANTEMINEDEDKACFVFSAYTQKPVDVVYLNTNNLKEILRVVKILCKKNITCRKPFTEKTFTFENNLATIIETNLDLSLYENPLNNLYENLGYKIMVSKFYKKPQGGN